MARKLADARLKHLETASTNLVLSSPAISAHLGTMRYDLLSSDRNAAAVKTHCVACGSLKLLGTNCHRVRNTQAKTTGFKDRMKQAQKDKKTIEVRCLICNSISLQEKTARLPRRQKRHVAKLSAEANVSEPSMDELNSTSPAVNSQPRTKRRARGNKPSLQTLIAGQSTLNSQSAKASGLDLMDFIKT